MATPNYWFKTAEGETTVPYMLIWEKGRQLKRVKEGNSYYRYTYNADGIRIKKEAKGITYTYFVDDNGNLLGEKREGEGVNIRLTYEYDATGILAFGYSDTITGQSGKVYYQKNVQGDIIGINWASGVTACIYDYDAWGNVILQSGDQYILGLNRILYRGYYQDIETGWYYLQSRYYDPSICRFINADSIDYLDAESLTGVNLYAYCANNPVMYADPSGHAQDAATFLQGLGRIFVGIVSIAVGISLVASGVAPLGMILMAGVTLSAGALTMINGAADIGESFTNKNFVRDDWFGSNQGVYDLYSGIIEGIAIMGTAISSGWLVHNIPRIKAYKNINSYQYTETMINNRYLEPTSQNYRPYANNLWAQKTIIKYGKMSYDYKSGFGHIFSYDGYRLGVNTLEKVIFHFGRGF